MPKFRPFYWPWQKSLAAVMLAALCFAVMLPQVFAKSFPPKANAAWIYDSQGSDGTPGSVKAGQFAHAMQQYNAHAPRSARIRELYVYGGDMEMYCPHGRVAECRSHDFHLYYSEAARRNKKSHAGKTTNTSVRAYAKRLRRAGDRQRIIFSPVIDGAVSGHGALGGFDRLTRRQAQAFADKVARQVCADPRVDGIQFDLEPFDVSKKAGQYYFYRRIARDFAARQTGCVDARHPHGRFFSVFTAASRIRPHSASARHVRQIMRVADNGYLIDSLYDLKGTPAGHQTPVTVYRHLVQQQTHHMRQWAQALGVKYQFAIPAAAATHEYGACRGQHCQPAKNPRGHAADNTQLDYVKAAMQAIRVSGAPHDSHYLGIALWAWCPGIEYGGMHFSPQEPSAAVKRYLHREL